MAVIVIIRADLHANTFPKQVEEQYPLPPLRPSLLYGVAEASVRIHS